MRAFRPAIVSVLVLAASPAAFAEVIDVNVTADLPDADLGDGVCDVDLDEPGLQSSLRAAIQHAATTSGSDTINLPAGRIRLTRKGAAEDLGATGDLDVASDIEIVGATGSAAGTVIDGAKAKDRVFHVTAGRLTLRNLTVSGGNAGTARGGGVLTELSGSVTVSNCAIVKCRSGDDGAGMTLNSGPNSISSTTFAKNASKDDSGALDLGAGTGLDVSDCLFTKNKAKDQGGAIENSGGELTVRNSTFSKNKAVEGGGAVSTETGSTTLFEHVTMAFNKSKTSSGAIVMEVDVTNEVSMRNSIVHRNGLVNSNAPFVSLGGNVESGDSCGFGQGDLVNTDARLGKLADNGGVTFTHALSADSPARNLASSGCPLTDQRGFARSGQPCDAGAFEFQEL